MISCIILSAGLSSRFGSPKPLAQISGNPIIVNIQNKIVSSEVAETIIVLGAHAEEIKPFILNHKDLRAVYNKDYNFGQTSSFQVGIKEANVRSNGYMLLPVDYPLIESETINQLIDNFHLLHPSILVPTHNGIKGHPPIFSSDLKKEICALDPQQGLNTVIHNHTEQTELIEVSDSGVIKTFNTQEEFEEFKK